MATLLRDKVTKDWWDEIRARETPLTGDDISKILDIFAEHITEKWRGYGDYIPTFDWTHFAKREGRIMTELSRDDIATVLFQIGLEQGIRLTMLAAQDPESEAARGIVERLKGVHSADVEALKGQLEMLERLMKTAQDMAREIADNLDKPKQGKLPLDGD